MSIEMIRELLQAQMNVSAGGVELAFENVAYLPKVGTPWQHAILLPAEPDNPTFGDDFKREIGIFQVMVSYPKSKGTQGADARADAICAGFKRGSTFTSGRVTVKILNSPRRGPAMPSDGTWYRVPVSIPYQADCFPAA